MDLQGLASPVADSVNPNISVTVQASTGYTNIGPGLRQVPSYAVPVTGFAQVQALSSSDLRQVEGMNIQGVMRKIYLRGALNGVIRPDGKGGDLVRIAGQTWLVVMTLELWPTWSCALIVKQDTRSRVAGNNFQYSEVPSGVIDGVNKTFVLATIPTPTLSPVLELNGVYQTQGLDYTLAGNVISMTEAPNPGDHLIAALYAF